MLISLNEAKKHLRVEHDADDDYITNLILASQQWAENFLNRKFKEIINNDNNEVNNNDGDNENNLSNDNIIDDENNNVDSESTENISTENSIDNNANDDDNDDDLIECQEVHKQAMLLVIGTWYEHRENTVITRGAEMLP